MPDPSIENAISAKDADEAQRHLLRWYRGVSRPLPWRKTRDPYAIWISEIMSQQTRVDTVIPYYERWLARFPDVYALARADIDDVLLLWQGLGYYRRARNIHAAAQYVVSERDGRWPTSAKSWQELPGIGPYTAGAIASIAFEEPTPALDGNVKRVLSRVCADDGEISRQSTLRRLQQQANVLVRHPHPGDINQALMELGATVCTPRAPACARCPLRPWCRGEQTGNPSQFPVKKRTQAPEKQHKHAWIAQRPRDLALFLAQRRPDILLGGLWETPLHDAPPDGPTWTECGALRHLFSHIDLRVTLWCCTDGDGSIDPPDIYARSGWISPRVLPMLPQSTLMRKILAQYHMRSAR